MVYRKPFYIEKLECQTFRVVRFLTECYQSSSSYHPPSEIKVFTFKENLSFTNKFPSKLYLFSENLSRFTLLSLHLLDLFQFNPQAFARLVQLAEATLGFLQSFLELFDLAL